ncbi:HECT-domain-containing protein [Peniophora sp. CONT]|nr:HECT-domain-containing protein [Peniophora sp. CONT]
MLPVFGNEKRRRMNLGGQSSSQSHDAIVNQARMRRGEREERRRQHDAALRIQAWWRGSLETRNIRFQLLQTFRSDPLSIRGMRCLVLIGKKPDALAIWSTAVLGSGVDTWLQNGVATPDRGSWLVLVRQISVLVLQDVADHPQDARSVPHLQVLDAVLSIAGVTRALGSQGPELTALVTTYVLPRGFYSSLAKALLNSPLEAAKNSKTLPLLVPLITHPLRTFNADTPAYSDAFSLLTQHILPIPLLPNRVPLASLTHLSSSLPLSNMNVLSPSIAPLVSLLSLESRIHLLSNLLAFAPPRYAKLPGPALATLLRLYATLMHALPPRALDPPEMRAFGTSGPSSSVWTTYDTDDSDDDSPITVTVVASTTAPAPTLRLPTLESRTRRRLQTVAADSHIKTLLAASGHFAAARPAFFDYLLALCTVWPARASGVLTGVMIAGGGVFRELYRGYVRSSPLGRDEGLSVLMDPANAEHWPPLLILNDLYAQALLTMADDEFFASDRAASIKTDTPRNPLSIDEVVAFSRRLLNIAFTLYWRDDQASLQDACAPGTSLRWDAIREKLTKALIAIHARDSRRPFTPPDHWLASGRFDMQAFIEAAIAEDAHLSRPTGTRALTSRQVAALSPRLGVLNNIPFAIPFATRFRILRAFVEADHIAHSHTDESADLRQQWSVVGGAPQRASVRRGHIAEDGFDKLGEVDLKGHIQIAFVDQFGDVEEGIDGGGVFKEFLTEICKEVFDSDRGLWLETKRNELYPNPHAYATEPHSLAWYKFIGRILGKAIYDGILVNVVFAGFFLAKWLGKSSFLDDLESLDPELYNGLLFLKRYPGNPEDLSLNFTIALEEFGVAKTIDLIPNGSNVAVTRDNRLEYILRTAHFRLTKQIKRQSDAFFEGLSEMIDPKWLRMFNQQELQVLLGGVDTPIDIDDWRAHTKYGGLFDNAHPTVAAFWSIVKSLTDEQQRALLRFVTSVGRPPLLGFKELNPPFCIRDSGGDETRLPTASTCFNLLKMPRYSSSVALKQKLLQALFSGAGFNLS